MLASLVYLLCALTSTLSAILLLIKFRSTRMRLLLWSGLGFAGLGLNNILLFVDMIIFPDGDLSLARTLPALVGIAILLWGFIWDTA